MSLDISLNFSYQQRSILYFRKSNLRKNKERWRPKNLNYDRKDNGPFDPPLLLSLSTENERYTIISITRDVVPIV